MPKPIVFRFSAADSERVRRLLDLPAPRRGGRLLAGMAVFLTLAAGIAAVLCMR